tara:strand:+ start:9297 stop:12617 length:3321 start_codon:yes stop_codon:yes gene_type:complete
MGIKLMVEKTLKMQQWEKASKDLGAKDTEYVAETEGGIPVTKPEQIASENRAKLNPLWQTVRAPFQTLGNILVPGGAPFGKDNPWVADQTALDARASELENMKTYRNKRDKVASDIAMLIHDMNIKNPDPSEQEILDFEKDLDSYVRSMGLSHKDFASVNPRTILLEDEFGFYSSTPNPYPGVERAQEAVAGIYGGLKGYKYGKLGVDAFGDVFKYGAKGAADRFKAGRNRMLKTRTVPGPWWAKALGVIAGGSVGVGIADYGYETELDILNKAGQAKNWLELSDSKMNQAIGNLIPEALTFGPTGINRPEQKERLTGALKDMAVDAAFTSAFFGIRPAYYYLRKFIGESGFRMFKPRAGKGVPTGQEIMAAEQRLLGSGKFNDFYRVSEGLIDETDPAVQKFIAASIKPEQEVALHIPLIGRGLTSVLRSPLFNFMRPIDLKMPLNTAADILPPLHKVPGTFIQRADVGSPLLAGGTKMFGRAPVLGGGIYNNKAQQMDAYMDLGESIIQKLTFAPIINVTDHGVRISDLGHRAARGFINAANQKQMNLLETARRYGAVVDDSTFVNAAKKMYERGLRQRQIVPGDSGSERIKKEIPEPFMNFLEKQVLAPGKAGARDIEMYYGLRQQMDELYKKWMKNADGESQADIINLYKAWEADIGKLSKSGIPDVERLWADYETFVSNGMLMFGTKAGKAMTGGIERVGMAINQVDPDRQASNLFNTVVDMAKADPATAAQNLTTMRNIVGDKAYYEGLGIYLNQAFNNSIITKEGAELFDGAAFKRALGLGKDNPLADLFKKALPGPQVSKLVVRDQRTGIIHEFDNANFNEGLRMANVEFAEGITERQLRQLPTQKDLADFATLMEAAAKNGIPEISTFMARRAVMGGIRSGIAAALPTSAIGIKAKTYGGLGALGAATGWVVPAALAFGVRYMGKIMTNPVTLNVYKNILDSTLPEQTLLSNFARMVRLMPEEWKEFDRELAEVENDQRYRETVGKQVAQPMTLYEQMKDAAGQIGDAGKNILDKTYGTESPALDLIDRIKEPPPAESIFADEAAFDSSSVGSSIMNNPIMNPSAAASLYEGDLDQALANQAAPRMAAKGGIISLVN